MRTLLTLIAILAVLASFACSAPVENGCTTDYECEVGT